MSMRFIIRKIKSNTTLFSPDKDRIPAQNTTELQNTNLNDLKRNTLGNVLGEMIDHSKLGPTNLLADGEEVRLNNRECGLKRKWPNKRRGVWSPGVVSGSSGG